MGNRPRKWLPALEMERVYQALGPLTEEDMRTLGPLSGREKNRWFQTIYGKYAARFAKMVYAHRLRIDEHKEG